LRPARSGRFGEDLAGNRQTVSRLGIGARGCGEHRRELSNVLIARFTPRRPVKKPREALTGRARRRSRRLARSRRGNPW
jgi:hypothetical protein